MNLPKKLFSILVVMAMLIPAGCAAQPHTDIAATTLPVYELTSLLCDGTGLNVARIINDDISCLHNYTLQVSQMRMLEQADAVVISGAGLEDFLTDALHTKLQIIDASTGVSPLCPDAEHLHHDDHIHETDPHIWLSPENGKLMAQNIYNGLCVLYPQHTEILSKNLSIVCNKFDELSFYAQEQLSGIETRKIITFHDGFSYMAQAYGLRILHSIEEESGSEASACELISLIQMVEQHQLPAIFVERNGSSSAASVISAETGVAVYHLDMGLSGESYFDAMYYNIRQLKEALT